MTKKTHKAKKSLGQNFLKSIPALNNIVKAGEIKPNDTILEIGPGKGALTSKLLETGATVLAVEKDNDLFSLLQEKFVKEKNENKLILINEDILSFNPIKMLSRPGLDSGYKVIANIPYNITGAILKKFLTARNSNGGQPILMVLMVQHEVAKRIISKENHKKPNKNVVQAGPGQSGGGKESLLSISVKAYGEPKMVMKVPARYFNPAPKVDSAVISIKNISRKFFINNNINEEKFWEVVHAGFAHKRKQIGKSIKKFVSSESYEKFKNKRAEDLSLEDWVYLLK